MKRVVKYILPLVVVAWLLFLWQKQKEQRLMIVDDKTAVQQSWQELWEQINKKTEEVVQKNEKICFEETCFSITIADTLETRGKGYMYVEHIPDNEGMLFVFERVGNYPFWMKNTLVSLDMIRLDGNYKILEIIENAEPCKADPCEHLWWDGRSSYVLEVKAGGVKRAGMEVGDVLERSTGKREMSSERRNKKTLFSCV